LVSSLVSLLSSKKNISSQFIDNYTALLFNIQSSNIELVHNLLDHNYSLSEKIDVIDYEIYTIKQTISGKSGISLEYLHKFISNDWSLECQQYSELITDIHEIFLKVFLLAEKVTMILENDMLKTKLSIEDCAILSKFRDVFHQHTK
jgi:hypothetical protein